MTKENPKHYAGAKKIPFGDIPAIVLAELGVAMHEGARKYGAFNYRKDAIIASDYYSAAMRHLFQWYELGEDTDPDSGISHITKAIACLTVLRDAQINGMVKDDRPPNVHGDRWYTLQDRVRELQERHPEPAKRITSWDSKVNNPPKSYRFFEPLAENTVDDCFTRAFEKLADIPSTSRAYGTSAAAVEMGEYFEPPVGGLTR